MIGPGGVPAELSIQTTQIQGVTVVRLGGELGAGGSNQLRDSLIDLVQNKTPAACVDLAGLSFINSAGIATLIECLQGMRKYDGKLALSGMNDTIRNVFQVARLDTVFTVRSDENEAVQRLSGQG